MAYSRMSGRPFVFLSGWQPMFSLTFQGCAATVDHEQSFMIYGGYSSTLGSRVDKIYKYNQGNSQWDEEVTTMSGAKSSVTAIKIKGSIFNSC